MPARAPAGARLLLHGREVARRRLHRAVCGLWVRKRVLELRGRPGAAAARGRIRGERGGGAAARAARMARARGRAGSALLGQDGCRSRAQGRAGMQAQARALTRVTRVTIARPHICFQALERSKLSGSRLNAPCHREHSVEHTVCAPSRALP